MHAGRHDLIHSSRIGQGLTEGQAASCELSRCASRAECTCSMRGAELSFSEAAAALDSCSRTSIRPQRRAGENGGQHV